MEFIRLLAVRFFTVFLILPLCGVAVVLYVRRYRRFVPVGRVAGITTKAPIMPGPRA
jgi:hypothetical protein